MKRLLLTMANAFLILILLLLSGCSMPAQDVASEVPASPEQQIAPSTNPLLEHVSEEPDAISFEEPELTPFEEDISVGEIIPSSEEIILDYFITEMKFTDKIAKNNIIKFQRHPDIMDEFVDWIKNRTFPENAISVEGYTAELLNETTFLSVVGSYNYLISLREEPEESLKRLREGFVIE